VQYQTLWSSGRITVSSIKLTLPTADAAAVITPPASALVTAA
jgi:hypothetical protein